MDEQNLQGASAEQPTQETPSPSDVTPTIPSSEAGPDIAAAQPEPSSEKPADNVGHEPVSYALTDKDLHLNPHLRNIGMQVGQEVKIEYVHPVRITLPDGAVLNGILSADDDGTDFVGTRPGKGRNG